MKIFFILLSFLSLSTTYILPDINLTISNASQFTTFYGAGTNYFFGYTLSDFGDINGDGIDDAIIGSPSISNSVPGIIYIIFGHKDGIPNLDLSNPINNAQGFMIVGQAGMGCFGCSVGKAGDFNGDGVEDIAIGSPSQGTGSVYIIFGVRGTTTNLYIPGDLPGRGFVISGAQSSGFFGLPVANAGDVNGDGLQDVIIGAYIETYNGPASGSVYVIFGRKTGITDFTVPNDLTSDLGFYVRGKQYDSLGISANGAGDFNGDGIDDIIIGAYAAQLPYRSDPGYAYIIFGRKTGFPNYDLAAGIGISEVSQIRGFASLNYFGYSVSKAGDVNNDGVDDIIVGAVGYNRAGKTGCGAAYVIFGRKDSGVFNMDLANGLSNTEGFAIYGANSGDALGYKVSNAGDINGDTIDDVAVSAYTAALPGKANAGAVYVIYGRKTGISDIDLASGLSNNALGFQIQGTSASSYLGFALSDAGDFNADGAPDLLMGAYGNQNPAGIKTGSAFIVYGVPAPANTIAKTTEIITQVQSAGALANQAAAIVLFFGKINNGLPLLFCFLVEMLYYVRYLKIVYPPKLQYLLEQPDPDFLSIPNISSAPEELVDYLPNYTIPVKFEYYGFYSSFLINFWPSIIMILIVGVIIIVALVLNYATKSKKWIHEKCLKLKQSLKWNYLIAMFTGYYSDIALQTFLEMRKVKFGSILEGLSFITCLLMNFTAVLVLVKMYLVLRKLKLAKQQTRKTNPSNSQDYEALKIKLRDFEVIFNSYKEDSFAQQCYLLLYSLRFYIFYSIVAYLFAYPVVQTSLISIMGAASLIYLGVKRPFTDKKELIMALIQETILQVVNISAFVLAVTDKGVNQTDRLRVVFGDIIIGCNVAFVLVGIFYSVIMLVLMFRDFYHSLKKKIKNKELHVKDCRTTTTQAAIVQPPFISRPEIDITSLNESQHNLNTPSFITNCTVHHQFNELILPEPAVSNSTSNVNSLNPFVGVNRRQQRMRIDSHFSLGDQDNTIQEINEKNIEQQDILTADNDKPLASNEGQVLENNSNIVISNNNSEVRGRIKALGLFYRREQALRKV